MRQFIKNRQPTDQQQVPDLEELFVASVRSSFELADMLGLTLDQYIDTIKTAWKIEKERIEAEATKQQERETT